MDDFSEDEDQQFFDHINLNYNKIFANFSSEKSSIHFASHKTIF